jgi:hypothetical protein
LLREFVLAVHPPQRGPSEDCALAVLGNAVSASAALRYQVDRFRVQEVER